MRVRVLVACLLALGCVPALALAGASAGTKTLTTTMKGAKEVPKGAPKGSGKAVVTLNASTGKVCWTFSNLKGLDKVTASHIHQAPVGKAGNVVVPFFAGTLKAKGCVTASKSVVAAIVKKPNGYYVNIHTVKYPAGAIRGQL